MGKSKKLPKRIDYLVFLAGLVFVMMAIVATTTFVSTPQKVLSETTVQYAGPALKEGVVEPEITAKAVYAEDLESGKPLFYKNAEEPILPASTTKIATALVVLQNYNLEDVATVSGMKSVSGQKMGLLDGENITIKNLLYGLLVHSGNDAAEVLSRVHSGGKENFILSMNRLADSLGLKKTHFVNPSGIDAYLHFSTARDLTKLAEFAIENPIFADLVKTQKADVTSVDGKITHHLESTNKLLGKVPGVLGVKTGTTTNSGESLITLIERDGHRVMISVLDSKDRFVDTETLIDWIFANYHWKLSAPQPIKT